MAPGARREPRGIVGDKTNPRGIAEQRRISNKAVNAEGDWGHPIQRYAPAVPPSGAAALNAFDYRASHQFIFTRKMLSGRVAVSARASRPRSNSPEASLLLRDCVQTKKSVEPGRYSHRKTALPRSDRTLKFGLPMLNEEAAPAPSGSTVYDVTRPSLLRFSTIVPASRPYTTTSRE